MKLAETFAVLKPDLSVDTIAVSPTVYDELDARFDRFRQHVLVSSHAFDADWGVWERHPAGDEIVVLLSGAATMHLKLPAGDKTVELREPGAYVVVPRNTWHTAEVSEPARMLFVTPGEGTEHQAEPATENA